MAGPWVRPPDLRAALGWGASAAGGGVHRARPADLAWDDTIPPLTPSIASPPPECRDVVVDAHPVRYSSREAVPLPFFLGPPSARYWEQPITSIAVDLTINCLSSSGYVGQTLPWCAGEGPISNGVEWI